MSRPSRCLLISAPGVIAPATTQVPAPAQGEVLVRTAWSCVSPGTELRCLAGLQTGAPAYPFIPGYALTGTVIESQDTTLQVGARVFCSGTHHAAHARCWGGHLEYAVASGSACVPVPDGLDLRLASAAKLAAIAYHGMRLSRPLPHERVYVIGLGPIGRLSAQLHALGGAMVFGTDLSARRRQAAAEAGLHVADSLKAMATLPNGADIVVDATGAGPVLLSAAQLLRPLPWDNALHSPTRLLLQGSYASPPSLPYNELFLSESQVLIPRDCQRRDLEAVLALMADGRLDVTDVVTDAGLPDHAPSIYAALRDRPDELMTAAFHWES